MPRAGLSRAAVVAEAAALADEAGAGGLTLAALAQRLGVKLPSLYKHVDGLADVRRELSILALHELAGVLGAAAVGRSGDDALRALAGAYRGYARAHPGRYEATVRAPEPADTAHVEAAGAVLRVVDAVLQGFRLAGDDAVDATRALRAALHGFASLEAAGGFGMPQDVDRSFERLVEALGAALAAWARG